MVQPEVSALDLVQIPEFGKKTRKLIDDIHVKINEDESLDQISSGITDVIVTLDDKYMEMSDTLKVLQLDRLDKESRELSLIGQRITEWKNTIQAINRYGQNKDSTALSMINIWQLTLESNNEGAKKKTSRKQPKETPTDLETEIRNFISDLQAARKNLGAYLDSVQKIQTEITLAENKLGSISALIESDKRLLKQSIFLPDAPPIWKVGRDTTSADLAQKLDDLFSSDSNILSAFFQNNPKLPYYFAVLAILIVSVILYLRVRSKTLYADYQGELKDANILLHNALLSTFIILWFCTLFFPSLPKELKDIISLVMLVPLVILLRKLNPGWKWYTMLLFSVSFVLFIVIRDIDYTHLFQRIFLLFVNVCIVLLFIYFRKRKNQAEKLNKYWFGSLSFFINLFIIIGSVALIANLYGNIQLAQLLNYVMLGVILAIYVLKTAVTLVRNFIFLILMGPLIKYSNILKEDGLFVLRKMDWFFRIFTFAAFIYLLLGFIGIRNETFAAIMNIINYELAVGEMSISLGNVLAFFITIQIAVWLSSFIRYILEKEVFPRSNLKPGVPNTILLMIKFSVVLLGILFAFSAAGIHMDKLAIAMGALGLGIGFGLQNIISNFISGIILAIERPITIGDLIEIPDVSGVVRDIGIRASTVRTWDGSDVIVPNAELISNKLTNWTFYDRLRRVKVDVRVPFDSDMEAVSRLLLDTAGKIPEVMKKPKPYLNFKGIGTSAMEITLYCWTDDSDKIFTYGTAIRKAVYKALKEAGFETPVPKQDLAIVSEQDAVNENPKK